MLAKGGVRHPPSQRNLPGTGLGGIRRGFDQISLWRKYLIKKKKRTRPYLLILDFVHLLEARMASVYYPADWSALPASGSIAQLQGGYLS